MIKYGAAPDNCGVFPLDFTEYMHFMYLPVTIREIDKAGHLPDRLWFLANIIELAMIDDAERSGGRDWDYIYLTARRGYATPGNPLNRPGWHSDGFGTSDVNYVWTDRFPTQYAVQEFHDISDDHMRSVQQFAEQVDPNKIVTYPDCTLQRLTPSVIHAAPEIPAPGGERSFVKISFSNNRYNLIGNSYNYELKYDWPMYPRQAVRNDPARAGRDSAS